MQKAYLTYNKNDFNDLKILSGLTTDESVRHKDIEFLSVERTIPIEQIGSIELSEQQYEECEEADIKTIDSEGKLVLTKFTPEAKSLQEKYNKAKQLKEELLQVQISLQACENLNIDKTEEQQKVSELLIQYNDILQQIEESK